MSKVNVFYAGDMEDYTDEQLLNSMGLDSSDDVELEGEIDTYQGELGVTYKGNEFTVQYRYDPTGYGGTGDSATITWDKGTDGHVAPGDSYNVKDDEPFAEWVRDAIKHINCSQYIENFKG